MSRRCTGFQASIVVSKGPDATILCWSVALSAMVYPGSQDHRRQAALVKRRGRADPQYGLEGRVWSPDSNNCTSHARPAWSPQVQRSAGLHSLRRHLRPGARLRCYPAGCLRQIGRYGLARCSAQACSTNSGRQISSTAVMANALAASIIPACPSGDAAAARNSSVWPLTVSGAILT